MIHYLSSVTWKIMSVNDRRKRFQENVIYSRFGLHCKFLSGQICEDLYYKIFLLQLFFSHNSDIAEYFRLFNMNEISRVRIGGWFIKMPLVMIFCKVSKSLVLWYRLWSKLQYSRPKVLIFIRIKTIKSFFLNNHDDFKLPLTQ